MGWTGPALDARSFLDFLNIENLRAEIEAAPFVEQPPANWPVNSELGYGALKYLLDIAREEHDRNPRRSLSFTILVLRRMRRTYVPAGFESRSRLLSGSAWKEHANSLLALGRHHHALLAARRAVKILGESELLVVDRAAALMVEAMITHRLGRTAEAMSLLNECRSVFDVTGEKRSLLHASLFEATMLYESDRYETARTWFLAAWSMAVELGADVECARIMNNIGHCARQLGNLHEGLMYLRAAAEAFDKGGTAAESLRARWGLARLLRDAGDREQAIREFERVREGFLNFGMNVDAALAGLDVVELYAACGDSARATEVARKLVDVFSDAGMQTSLRIALAYVAEQASLSSAGTNQFQETIRSVRRFLWKLTVDPATLFPLQESA